MERQNELEDGWMCTPFSLLNANEDKNTFISMLFLFYYVEQFTDACLSKKS